MNHQEVRTWQDAVMEHSIEVKKIREDHQLLKDKLEEHLKQFFEYDSIEWDAFFDEIILKFDKNSNPRINHNSIHQLGMDWMIGAGYDEDACRIVIIKVYPFGFNEGD